MADKNDRRKRKVLRELIRRMFRRVLLSSLVYLAALTAILVAGYILGNSVIWYGTEPFYPILRYVSDHVFGVGYFLFSVGETAILLFWFAWLIGCFQTMADAMSGLYRENASAVELPVELREIEAQMNAVRDQLQISRLQAREAEQRKNDLVVYLAHDLKTPLTSVLGYLMLLEENPELPAQSRAKYVGIAVKKAQRLEELINEFFEITRFNLTTMELELQSINFTRLLQQTIFEFQPFLQEKQMTCRLETDREVMITCDLDKLQRVVDNLLRNSVLYGYEGSEITLTLERDGGNVRFRCVNHGPTIPEGKLERIFDQFYRLDSARASSTGGAGLGLAIAREIVRLHGGEIRAQSRDEVTEFTVILPGKT